MDTREMAVVREHVEDATADIDVWADRHEPDPRARRYASAAVGAIDSALAELQAIRARLVTEIRAADDASAKRADALLADAGTRASAGQCADRHAIGNCTRTAGHDGYHQDRDGFIWGQPPTRALASCGHPSDEDGECSCSSWPERAPLASLQGYGYVLPEDYLRGGAQ